MGVTEEYYIKTCVCPNCTHKFTTRKIRRGSQRFVKRDADFCTYYQNQSLNPILYTVNVCPLCGFSYHDSSQPKLYPSLRKTILDNITSRWTPKDFGSARSFPVAIAAYKLAIYTSRLIEEPHSLKAGLYLRLAWIYRFLGKEEEEKGLLALAAQEYEQSYTYSDYIRGDKEMSEVKILYLIGELYRRIEKYDQAVQYFSRSAALKNQTIEQGMIRLARDQWALAREEYNLKRLR